MTHKIFHWTGYEKNGLLQTGMMLANNKQIVIKFLLDADILPKKISRIIFLTTYFSKIKYSVHFIRQLQMLLCANIPLGKAIALITAETPPKYQHIVLAISQDIQNGCSLSESLRKHSSFSSLLCDLIEIGEASCSLNAILLTIMSHQEKSSSFKRQIIQIMTYPVCVLFITLLIFLGLFLVVVPQFEAIFHDFGAQLPVYTRLLLHISHMVKQTYAIDLVMLCSVIAAYIYFKKRCARIAKISEWLTLKSPGLGKFYQKIIIIRITQVFAITYQNGLPLLRVLDCCAMACGSHIYRTAISQIKTQVSNGVTLTKALTHTQLFSSFMVHMIHVGEESATLLQVIQHIAQQYEQDIAQYLVLFKSLLEPVIMTILGTLVGSILIALYLPILGLNGIL